MVIKKHRGLKLFNVLHLKTMAFRSSSPFLCSTSLISSFLMVQSSKELTVDRQKTVEFLKFLKHNSNHLPQLP